MSALPVLHMTNVAPVSVDNEIDLAGLINQSYPDGTTCWARSTQTCFILDSQSAAGTVPGVSVAIPTGGAWLAFTSASGITALEVNTVVGAGLSLANIIPAAPVTATVKGFSAAGDGGGGAVFWDPTYAGAVNSVTSYRPTLAVIGAWFRIFSGAINVLWAGAKGDGATDDLAALNRAVLAVPVTGGGLYFPGNVNTVRIYKTTDSTTFTGYANLVVYSDGLAAIKQATNKRGFTFDTCTDVEVHSMQFLGTIQVDGGNPGGPNISQAGITLETCTAVKIHHCVFKNLGGYGVNPHVANTDVTVSENRFDQTMAGCQTGGGVGIVNTNLKIIDNTFIGFIPTGGVGTIGSDDQIAVFGGLSGKTIISRNFVDKRGVDAPSKALTEAHCITVESGGVGGNISDLIIEDNICVNCASTVAQGRAAIEVLADPGGVPSNIHINGNIIRTANAGIVINAGGGAYDIHDIQVNNNDISDIQLGVTILPAGISLNSPAAGGPTEARIAVCNNNIDTIADGTSTGINVSVGTANNVKIKDNFVSGVVGNGMLLDTNGSDWDVSGNTVTGSGANGIAVINSGAGGRCKFIGNEAESNGAEGFNLQSLTDTTIIGNIAKGNTADGFYLQSMTDVVMEANQSVGNTGNGLITVTQVTNFRCIGNSFHDNTGFGIVYGGTTNSAEFIANYLTGNTGGTFQDASVTSTTFYLANPQLLKSIALAGIAAPTAGESPVVTPAGIWLNAGISTGADLASGSQTVTAAQGGMRWMRAATMLVNSDVHLSVAGPPRTGQVIGIVDLDTSAHTLAVINDGPAAGTLLTFAASEHGAGYFRFNGTDWEFSTFQPVVTDA